MREKLELPCTPGCDARSVWPTAALLFVLMMVGTTQAAGWGYQSVGAGIP